jgi:hypothetical protein
LLFLSFSACISTDGQREPTDESQESIVGQVGNATIDSRPEGITVNARGHDDKSDSVWNGFATAVEGLPSYSRQMTIQFEPVHDNADAQSWQIESFYQFSVDPSVELHELRYQGTAPVRDLPAMSLLASDSGHYLVIPEGACLTISEEEFTRMNSGILDPDFFLSEVDEIKRVGSVVLNTQPVDHYEVERHLLSKESFQEVVVAGDIYMSQTDSFPVQLDLIVSGLGGFSETDRIEEGTLTIYIGLNRLDASTSIVLPQSCSDDYLYPLPTGSYDIAVIDDLLGYRVKQSIRETVSYYLLEMEAAGYLLSEEPTVTEEMALMTFTLAGEELIVHIEMGQEPGEVSVLVSP